jgi:prepilin-type processing-associated H-X9-DG protein
MTLLDVLLALAIIGVLVALLVPALAFSRGLSRRVACTNNLRNIGSALFSYQERHRQIPNAVTAQVVSSAGPVTVQTTWLAMLLMEMDERPIFEEYNYERSYDDPANQTVVAQRVRGYLCPAGDDESVDGFAMSHYVLGGEATRRIDRQRDRMIVAGEIARRHLGWARPGGGDGPVDPNLPYSVYRSGITPAECATPGINVIPTCPDGKEDFHQFSSAHTAGANFLFADGRVTYIANQVDMETFRSMLTSRE